ncbi:queuosine precursor transporter [Patescibacteria group bacterium]|nr:queuosine precursor transporter [Patescibacteria group bacterium]
MKLSNLTKKEIWSVILLVGSYLVFQALADIGATKIVRIHSFTIPAGTFIFTLTFTLRDMLHKRLGKEWAKATILTAGGLNLVMAMYLQLMAVLPSPKFFELGEAWNSIFGLVPSITIASIVAEVISELIDTEIYQLWKNRFSKFPQWSRVLVSNAVSLPIDSLIFAVLAFTFLPLIFGGESLGISTALGLTMGQIVWKTIVTVISLPGIYLVKGRD